MPEWAIFLVYALACYGFIMLFYPFLKKNKTNTKLSLSPEEKSGSIDSDDSGLIDQKNETAAALEVLSEVVEDSHEGVRIHITILDDDEIMPLFLGEQLKETILDQLGTNLEWYREPEEFIQSGRLDQPGKHILILDGMLPRMDGLEVLQWVTKKYDRQRVEVIMVSGRTKESDIVSAFQLGADDYVIKPFKIHELIARLTRTIQRMM